MNAYAITLWLHSYLRWIVLALVALVLWRCTHGVLRSRPWERGDERAHVLMVAAVDTQFTFGALLYLFLSPFVRAFYADVGAGMKHSLLRFFGIEHVLSMVLAVALIHVGRTRSKQLASSPMRHRRVLISLSFALLLILIAIPWPFMPYPRPLLR